MLCKNDIVQMMITDITDEGNGVGKTADGFAVFIPGTAVGDELMARLVKVQKSYAYGIIEKLLVPSPHRIEADCQVYRQCGGCSLRHISYDAELATKQNWVEQHLRRIGGISAPVLPIIGSPEQEGYRNKTQCPIRNDGESVRLGMFGKHSHRVIQCTNCRLQPAHFEKILQTVQDFCKEYQIPVYNEDKHTGLLRHVYIRFAQATNQTMVCLVVNGTALPHSAQLVEALVAACPSVNAILLNSNTAKTNVILGKTNLTLWGKSNITDILCGLTIHISPLSFYQVNRKGAERLYGIVADFAGLTGTEVLLDLYCGAGTIGLSMASKVRQLVGVEIVQAAVLDAQQNALDNGITNARFLCDDAKGAAATLHREGLLPDVVVLDPPRKGCDASVLQTVAEMQPSRIVMVSCNSATLARDLALLAGLGYQTVKAQPVDMFPRTAHVECVVELHRVEK